MKFKKETNSQKKLRLFGPGTSPVKPLIGNDNRSKEERLIEKLIYKDCYDSSGALVKRKNFGRLKNLNPSSFKSSKKSKLSKKLGKDMTYHPRM
jgi:hypothetical protein